MSIILDVDGVLADFIDAFVYKAHDLGVAGFPCCSTTIPYWGVSAQQDQFQQVWNSIKGDIQFWLNIRPLPGTPRNIKPEFYLTSRPVQSVITRTWLTNNGFPSAPVITVSKPEEKIKILRSKKELTLIDDYYITVQQALREDLKAYLFKAPYQLGHDVRELPLITWQEISKLATL